MDARIGRAARAARQHAGLDLRYVALFAGVSEATLSRFENGGGWRRETNAIVIAYADACGTTARDIWRAAVEAPDDPR